MEASVDSLFTEAMKLPADDREALAARLYSSLHEGLELDPAWDAEIARRVEELKSGKLKGVPAEEAFERLRSIKDAGV